MHELVLATPVGWVRIIAGDTFLIAIEKATAKAGPKMTRHPLLLKASRQLKEYFAGERTSFDLPLAPAPTLFQATVRAALLKIPFGQTASYAAVAKAVGTKSPRAVGQAVGSNCFLILVPCHRVVATNGLGGFAWGLPTKKKLLAAEGK